MADRYGLSAQFGFEVTSGSFATIDKTQAKLQGLEKAVGSLETAVTKTNVGSGLKQQFSQAGSTFSKAQNQVAKTEKGFVDMTRKLRPLREEFKALKAESRNISFGDLDDPRKFDQAKQGVDRYVQSLQRLESQIEGASLAERKLKADLQSQQRIARNRVEQATQQREIARASNLQGKGTAIAAGGVAVAAPLIGFGGQALQITKQFDDQLKAIAAVTAPAERTQQNLARIEAKAKQLGATTRFSASDAASGFVLLAQAGFDVQKQLSTIDATLDLAAAGNIDLAESTRIVVSGLGQFKLAASDSTRLANILAQTAANGQTDIAALGQTLKVAGTAAETFGSSPEKMLALAGALSKVGKVGAEAGTDIRNVFQRLTDVSRRPILDQLGVSVTDSAGNFKDITQILRELGDATAGLTEGDRAAKLGKLFDSATVGSATNLISLAVDGTIDQIERANFAAAEAAATQRNIMEAGIGGALRSLNSAFEGMMLEIGQQLAPTIQMLADLLSKVLMAFINLPGPVKQGIVVFGTLATGLGVLAVAIGTATAAFAGMRLAMAQASLASGVMSNGLLPLTGYFQTAIGAIGSGGFSGVLMSASGAMGVVTGSLASLGATLSGGFMAALAAVTSPVGLVIAGIVALYAAIEALTPTINVLGNVLSAIAAPIGFVAGVVSGLAQGIMQGLKPAIEQVTNALSPFTNALNGAFGGIGEAVSMAVTSFQTMFSSGEQLGQMLSQVVLMPFTQTANAIKGIISLFEAIGNTAAAPFEFVSNVVTQTLTFIGQSWQQFIDWLTGALLAVPNTVAGAFNKILPPFLRKDGDDDSRSNIPARTTPPASPPSFPAANRILAFKPAPKPVLSGITTPEANKSSIDNFKSQALQVAIEPVVNQASIQPQLDSLSGGVGQFGLPLAVAPTIQPFVADMVSQVVAQLPQAKEAISQRLGPLFELTPQVDIQPVEMLKKAVQGVGSQFKAAAFSAVFLGIASLTSLSPVVLVLGGMAVTVLAISTNFLGLRTILRGIGQIVLGTFNIVRGAIELIVGVIRSAIQLTQGLGQVLKGIPAIVRGDFSQIQQGFQTMRGALTSGADTVRQSLARMGTGATQIFRGAGNVVKGLGQAVDQTVKGTIFAIKSLPSVIRGTTNTIRAVWTNTSQFIEALKLIPARLGGLQSFPGQVQSVLVEAKQRLEAVLSTIRGLWSQLELRFPQVSLGNLATVPERINGFVDQARSIWSQLQLRLPEIGLGNLATIPERIDGFIGQARSIWSQLQLRLPQVNLGNLAAIPDRVSGFVSQAREIWGQFQPRLPEINLSSFATLPDRIRGFIQTAVQIVEAGIDKISALWSGLSEKFQGVMGVMGNVAKKVGKGFIRDLAENSPGPTFQIRSKWQMTTERIEQNLTQLRQLAGVAGKAIGQEIATGANQAATKAQAKLAGLRGALVGLKDNKGVGALGRSASSIGMSLANVSPQLAMPLFVMSDLIDTSQTLTESLPQARKAFANLGPTVRQLQGNFIQLLPVIRNGFGTALQVGKSAVLAMLPVVQTLGTQLIALLPVIGAQLASLATAFVGMASSAIAALIPLALPFLPVIAGVAAVVGGVMLLKTAFTNNFLGLRSAVQAVGASIKFALLLPFRLLGQLANAGLNQAKSIWSNFTGWLFARITAIPGLIAQTIYQSINDLANVIFSLVNPLQIVGGVAEFVMNLLGGAANWVTGAWQGFSEWFGGTMTGLVEMGKGAGIGLINALNHNPTVRIPLAWKHATQDMVSMMQETMVSAEGMGGGMVGTFRAAARGIEFSMRGSFQRAADAAKMFAFHSIFALAPVGLSAIGLGLIIAAIGSNFLGLRDVAKGAMQVVKGAIQAVAVVLKGLHQIIQGIGTAIKGVFIGDFNLALQGFQVIGQGIRGVAVGVADAIHTAFSGAIFAVRGLFAGMARFIDRVFQLLRVESLNAGQAISNIGAAFTSVGQLVKSAIQAPQQAWTAFLGVIDRIETKVRGVASAIAQSPLGKFTRSATDVAAGKASNLQSARTGIDFDDDLANRNPAANVIAPKAESFRSRIGNFFKPKTPQPTPTAQTVTQATDNLSIDKFNAASNAKQATESTARINQVKSAGVSAATEAGAAIQNIISTVSPGLGGLIGGVLTLISSFAALATSIPALVTSMTAAGGAAGVWGTVTTAATGFVTAGFAAVGTAAGAMWAAITGPLLPFIAAFAAVGVAIGAVVLAIRNNFLGLGDLFGAVWQGIQSTVGELFGIIKSAWDDSVGGIVTQAMQLKQVFVDAFTPLFSLFSGGEGGNGFGGFIKAALFGLTLQFRVIAVVIGGVIRTVGNLVSGFLVFAQVMTSIVLTPLKAVFQAAGDIKQAFDELVGAVIQPFTPLIQIAQQFFAQFNQGTDASNQAFSALKTTIEFALIPLRVGFTILATGIRLIGFAIAGVIKGFQMVATVLLLPVQIATFFAQTIFGVGQAIHQAIVAPLQAVMDFATNILQFILNIPTSIANAVGNALEQVKGFFGGIGQKIAGIPVIGNIFSFVTGLGKREEKGNSAGSAGANVKRFAQGGSVNAGSGVEDTVEALLTPGEFVLKPDAAALYRPLLPALNSGRAGLGAIAQFLQEKAGINFSGLAAPTPESVTPTISPQPIPRLVPATPRGSAANTGPVLPSKLEVNVNVDQINVSSVGQGGNELASQQMVMELLDQLKPHLSYAVTDILREATDKVR